MTKIRSRSSGSIQDRRGQGGGGGGGLGGLGGMNFPVGKAGGGMLGIIVLLATMFLPKLLGGVSGASSPSAPANDSQSSGAVECETEIEQIVCGAVDDVQAYWTAQYPESYQAEYQPADTVLFSGFTDTGCGQASSEVGPFYCPADSLVYFDLDFLLQLQDQFAATGDLAAQYIVAHEYGHHVQNVLGINARVRQAQESDPDRANEYSIALELHADCLAGAWASDAAAAGEFDNPQEVQEALDAAAAVGDDRIQQQTQGRVDRETWTHGSSEQRVQWFRQGFDSADPATCDGSFEGLSLG